MLLTIRQRYPLLPDGLDRLPRNNSNSRTRSAAGPTVIACRAARLPTRAREQSER